MTTSLQHSSKDAILYYLLKENKASAQAIAQAMKITPQATRRHLKELEKLGLIEHELTPVKIGRPQYIYFLSRQGRDRFPQNYGEFAVSFLDTLTETVGEHEVSKVLKKQWQKKAQQYRQYLTDKDLAQKVNQLVAMRQKEGFMAEVFEIEPSDEAPESSPRYFITEHNCAISDVASSYPQVCTHELEMFVSLFPECSVERTNWINNGENLCGYLIAMKSVTEK